MIVTTVMTITLDLEIDQKDFDEWKSDRYKGWRSDLPSEEAMLNEYLNQQVEVDIHFYDLAKKVVEIIPDPEDRRFNDNFVHSHRSARLPREIN